MKSINKKRIPIPKNNLQRNSLALDTRRAGEDSIAIRRDGATPYQKLNYSAVSRQASADSTLATASEPNANRLFCRLGIISLALISCLHTAAWGLDNAAIFEKTKVALRYGDIETVETLMQPLAEQGDAQAQYFLSSALDRKAPKLAQQWLQKAADQGYIHAQFSLAMKKTFANKTPVPQTIVDKLMALADNDDREALLDLVWLTQVYEMEGIAVDARYEKYSRKAALLNVAGAQEALSRRYDEQKNSILAIFWARKSAMSTAAQAKAGSVGAQLRLGDLYRYGNWSLSSKGGDIESPTLAEYWYEQAAKKSPRGSEKLGRVYLERYQDYARYMGSEGKAISSELLDKAIDWFEKAIEQGGRKSIAKTLAELYTEKSATDDDREKAKKYHAMFMADLIEAVASGTVDYPPNDPSRQKEIGNAYLNAPVGLKNFAEAEKWFKKSYEQGHAEAATALGLLYLNSNNPHKDFATAKQWLEKAGEKGDSDAMFQLGEAYFTGQNTQRDLDAAEQWFKKAVEKDKNNYKATKRLKNMPQYKKYVRPNITLTEGIVDILNGNSGQGKSLLRPLAEAGNAEAQYYMSRPYSGWGRPDRTWLKKSAENGFAQAQIEWAAVILNDNTISQAERNKQTLQWVEKAAAQNNVEAVASLAYTYEKGAFSERDAKKALKWYEKLLTLDDIDEYRDNATVRIEQLKSQIEKNQ